MALKFGRSVYQYARFAKVNSFAKSLPCSGASIHSTVMGDEKPVETAIRTKLTEALKPQHLDVINESYMHNVPKGTESHFKVVIVSTAFENVKRLQKHQLVHKALEEELESSIHALSIVAKTPKEWETSQDVGQSPPCRGGAGL
ncbi:bolA-like protein 1 [Aplysia californica]|uniref:BolA-like protein 1 n=1 Tax=Aplysia californica TaxID=6500 RepID=A0ABM0JD89_APLCA|nr:bolA-like protein 1 [Aplysia californica]